MKVSEAIKVLTDMQNAYGDLDFTITMSGKKSELVGQEDGFLLGSIEVFFGYDQYKDQPDEINVRNFPY